MTESEVKQVHSRIIREYMDRRHLGLYYDSLYPESGAKHPDVFYDEEEYEWKAILEDHSCISGDIRSVLRKYTGMEIFYDYNLKGKRQSTPLFEFVLRAVVEEPGDFDLIGCTKSYSEQELLFLQSIRVRLLKDRKGSLYGHTAMKKLFFDSEESIKTEQ